MPLPCLVSSPLRRSASKRPNFTHRGAAAGWSTDVCSPDSALGEVGGFPSNSTLHPRLGLYGTSGNRLLILRAFSGERANTSKRSPDPLIGRRPLGIVRGLPPAQRNVTCTARPSERATPTRPLSRANYGSLRMEGPAAMQQSRSGRRSQISPTDACLPPWRAAADPP